MSINAGQDGPPSATTIYITHYIASARKIAARIGMIFDDKMIWCSVMGEIEISGDAHVGQFIASGTEGPRQMQVRRQ